MVAGEITTQIKIGYETVVRGVVAKIGFGSCVVDLPSVDSNKQSPALQGECMWARTIWM